MSRKRGSVWNDKDSTDAVGEVFFRKKWLMAVVEKRLEPMPEASSAVHSLLLWYSD